MRNIIRSLANGLCSSLLVLCSLPVLAQAKEEFIWERYTSAWVSDPDSAGTIQRPNTMLPASLRKIKAPISLFIPKKKAHFKSDNGEDYIQVYLINSLADTLKISRADDTITGISTEIYVNGQWKIFQTHTSSSCGYGHRVMKMLPNHYLRLELENRTKGPIEVPYRVRLKAAPREIVSNPTTIHITTELLQLAGTKPPAITI